MLLHVGTVPSAKVGVRVCARVCESMYGQRRSCVWFSQIGTATATGSSAISSTATGGKVVIASTVGVRRIPVTNATGTAPIESSVGIATAAAMGVFILCIAGCVAGLTSLLLFVAFRKYTQIPITVMIAHGTPNPKAIPRTVTSRDWISTADARIP